MKYLLFIIIFIPQLLLSDETKVPLEESSSNGIACALVLEGDYNFKSRMEELGCKKGDPIMFYNHAKKACPYINFVMLNEVVKENRNGKVTNDNTR